MSEERKQIEQIREAFEQEFGRFAHLRVEIDGLSLTDAENLSRELVELKTKHTGKKSEIAGAKKLIGRVAPEERGAFGQFVQTIEKEIVAAIEEIENNLKNFVSKAKIEREKLDVTLPGKRPRVGHLHPITLLRQRIEDIFVSLGYAIEDDREIETDYYNFDALNIPEGHPARESQDTFYTTNGFALRSQTSTVQIRAMERRGVPIRIIAPGRVFRRDTPDLTHTPMFHQIEGLCVDKGITMAHLKGTVGVWLRRLFSKETKIRLRPSYFPFTEPSAEFDFSCFKCGGTGIFENERCRPCKGSGWIELGGSGMVHPNVLRACNVDPQVYSGFAFGFGLERMCSLMYSLDDIRLMFENDVRFLEQFR
ncbi:MAG: phenylalanine--tRNA ligase subunit alpha [Acidobacteria bacterium]|nr:phenylalanine--tRNA ligase subunit alpha [Acidobacteriota bacterium]MCA1638989.1 phenylalanine--tRNA ligase subunit alpha [Acidobacteriota bacterium]